MLREAKEHCDYLICGFAGLIPSIDRQNKRFLEAVIQTIVERYTQLKGVEYVDEIVPMAQNKI